MKIRLDEIYIGLSLTGFAEGITALPGLEIAVSQNIDSRLGIKIHIDAISVKDLELLSKKFLELALIVDTKFK